jgi:hypothetical protein
MGELVWKLLIHIVTVKPVIGDQFYGSVADRGLHAYAKGTHETSAHAPRTTSLRSVRTKVAPRAASPIQS